MLYLGIDMTSYLDILKPRFDLAQYFISDQIAALRVFLEYEFLLPAHRNVEDLFSASSLVVMLGR